MAAKRVLIATGQRVCDGTYRDERPCSDRAVFLVWPHSVGFRGFDRDDAMPSCAQHLSQVVRTVLKADPRRSTVGVEPITGKGV